MIDPLADFSKDVLLVVQGEKLAVTLQKLMPANVTVLPFESTKFFPSILGAAIAVMPEQVPNSVRTQRYEAWLSEYVVPRLPSRENHPVDEFLFRL